MGIGNRSAIGTLVERTTRFVMLHLPDGRTAEHVRDALVRAFADLPPALARSLTWDQGTEMSRNDEFTRATDIPVFSCDPACPCQRGSNENGLLRQYFPKDTDLSLYSYRADDLATVATVATVAANSTTTPERSSTGRPLPNSSVSSSQHSPDAVLRTTLESAV